MTRQTSAAQQAGSLDAVLRQMAAALPADRTLLVDGDRRVTLGEFAAQTEQLAWLIAAHFNGDARGRHVALLFPHTPPSLIGFHAVLRSGATALPLAVEQGEAFQRRIADEASPELWITTTQLLSAVRALVGETVPVLCIDQLPAEIAAVDLLLLDPQQTVLFYATSGSTGRPRLVERTTVQLLNYIDVFTENADLHQSARFAHLHLYAFAAGAVGALAALLNGATVVFGEAHADSSGALYRLLAAERVTHMVAVLPLIRALSEVAELRGPLPDLRVLITGGEKITAQDWSRLAGMVGPQAMVLLNYGSTEAMGTASQRLSFADADAVQRETALTALPDCTITIVDEQLRPLPVGAEGEITISSPRIGSGYYGMPELTAERFPFDAAGRRVYRSGDRGKLLPDGRFTVTGRADFMVKIRGYRVELEAIEAALAAQPELLESAVTTREIAGAQQLVAYLVVRDGQAISAAQLWQRLTRQLPLYAVPLRYSVMPSLPRTATHKVDRAALPAAVTLRREDLVAYRAPQGDLEQRLSLEWADLLGYDRVGVDDDFFALGGDSLSLYRLLTRIEREFAVAISPAQLQRITIAELARRLTVTVAGTQPMAAGPRRSSRQSRQPLMLWQSALRLLPYRFVHDLLRLLCAVPLLRRRLFGRYAQVLQEWLPSDDPAGSRLTDGLLHQVLRGWRRSAFTKPSVRRQHLHVSGIEYLQRPAGRGLVVVGMHTGVGWIVPTIIEQYDPQFAQVTASGRPAPMERPDRLAQTRRLKQLLQARHRLEQGGIVMIAGDGHHGHGLTSRVVLGRHLTIRPGAAELAAQTDSLFVPVFTRLLSNGDLLVEFQPPLQSSAASPEERTAQLLEAYADLLAARISAFPQAMTAGWLAQLRYYQWV